METETTKKIPLKITEERELKAFLFIAQSVNIESQQGVHIVFSYDLEKAMENVEKIVPMNMFIKESGSVPVKDLFKRIEGFERVIDPPQKIEVRLPPVLSTREQFINNLKLCANEYVENKKDKSQLLKIIDKINVKEKGDRP